MSFDLRAVIRLDDRMSGPLRKVTANMDKTNRMAQTAGGSIKRMGDVGRSAFDRINVSAGTLLKTFAAVEVMKKSAEFIGDSLKKSMDFEAEMSSIQALTGATNAEMSEMSKLALKAGADTSWSASQSSKAIEELLKAGLTPATVKAGGLEAALNLATAGGLDLAGAAEIMSTALNSFKKDAMTAAQASDILAGTANASATGVEDLRFSLAAVGAVAAGVGMTFKDTNTALGLFANNGLKGSDAGTSLKTMLQNLQPQTKQQVELFKRLGLMANNGANAFYTAAGKVQSLDKIAGTLHKSLEKLTDQQRSMALEVLFGTDAVRAANILYEEGTKGVDDFYQEMSKVSALDVAKKKMDNAAGAVEQFKGALETLQISGLAPILPMIKNFAKAAADFVTQKTPQITAAIQRMVDTAKNYLNTHFINNPLFNKLDLQGKINFVVSDVERIFSEWYQNEGKSKLQSMAASITGTLATGLSDNVGPITDSALKIGRSIAGGVTDGFMQAMSQHPFGSVMLGAMAGARFGPYGALVGGGLGLVGSKAADAYMQGKNNSEFIKSGGVNGWIEKAKGGSTPVMSGGGAVTNPDGSMTLPQSSIDRLTNGWGTTPEKRAVGITNVPYNNVYSLHQGEAVLPKPQADEYRSGGGRGSPSVKIDIQQMVVRRESDIDDIADQLAKRLNHTFAYGG